MAIVVEGVDNSGKSTLARMIARRLDYTLVESEGPPMYKGEMNARIEKYFSHNRRTVYARHPCVSQVIYSKMRNDPNEELVNPQFVMEFYDQNHVFVYCDAAGRGLRDHVVKERDSIEHLKEIEDHYLMLCGLYTEWALTRANLIYRIGDSMNRVVCACAAMVEAR